MNCEAGSFFHHHNPHKFLQLKVLRLYFPMLDAWVVWSVSLHSCSLALSACQCGTAWSTSHSLACTYCCLAPLPQLPFCAPPTSLGECFFFNTLGIRLPYSLIFWQFCVFWFVCLFLNLLLSFFLLYKVAKHIYLHCHLDQKFFHFSLKLDGLQSPGFLFFLASGFLTFC